MSPKTDQQFNRLTMQINISLDEISKKTGVSVDKLRRLRKAGKIPSGYQVHKHAPVLYTQQEFTKIQESLWPTLNLMRSDLT